MYGYEEYIDITPEQILQKIPAQKIFEFILKEPFSFNDRYYSPLRKHKNKGTCRFERREDGTILFVDFGDVTTHRTCFGLLMEVEKISLQEAIKRIVKHFKLSKDTSHYEDVIIEKKEYKKGENTIDTSITYKARPTEKKDKIEWSQFLITEQDLIEDKVFPAASFTIQKPGENRKYITAYNLCYAIDFGVRVKLYQPYGGDYKFITNCNADDVGNFDNLPEKGDKLIITKSYKDHRVLRNVLNINYVVWFQNEGMIPSEFILQNLLQRFQTIYIFFDQDKTGRLAAKKLVGILEELRKGSTKRVFINKRCGAKDPGELVKKEGRQDALTILNKILQ